MLFSWWRRRRRRKIAQAPFPGSWREMLERRVPFYRVLPADLKETFHGQLQVFVREKTFTGARGFEITDEVRVVIAASAVRLVLHLGIEQYDDLSEIIVYASHFHDPDRDGVILGQAHPWGVVILSWQAVLHGLANPGDGLDTAIHEFAHILDVRDGTFDGTPELRAHEDYRPWVENLTRNFEDLKERRGRRHRVLRDYGTLNPAEFFAVATEAFFEKPSRMRELHPGLHEELRRYYGFDPASDGLEGVPSGEEIGRNSPCPCGSGKKYKRCCGPA